LRLAASRRQTAHMAADELASELDLARKALDAGDPSHAIHHASIAMACAPTDGRVERLLEEIALAAGDSFLDLVPSTGNMYHGMAALRAWALHRGERVGDAAPMLLRAQAAAPETDYLRLVERWLAKDGMVGRLDADSFTGGLNAIDAALPKLRSRVLALAELASSALSDSDMLRFTICVLRRKSGRLDAAASLAEAWVAERPGYWSHVALGNARRHQGRLEEAIAQFREAMAFVPDDTAALLDVGDLSMETGNVREALEAYDVVLAREPEHPWAHPSALFLRAREPEGDAAGRSLLSWARAHPEDARAADLATRLFPFTFALPPRPEAMISGAAQALGKDLSVTKLTVTSFEAPSALRALRAVLGEKGARLEVSFGEIPRPDPRDPLERVPFAAWKFPHRGLLGRLTGDRAIDAEPALAPPPSAPAGSIAALAARPFDREVWWVGAASVVTEHGIDAARAAALGCLVHTPPCPLADLWWWDWMFRVQVASVLVLGRLNSGWSEGPRREVLTTLLRGPVDWVCTAALVATAEIAEREHDARESCLELLASALDLRPESPVVVMCIVRPAVDLLRRFDDLPPGLRQRVDRLYRDLEQD
jgi:tetratricopeptide (TPR) repeat protein